MEAFLGSGGWERTPLFFPAPYWSSRSFSPHTQTQASCPHWKWETNDPARMIDIPNPLRREANPHSHHCVSAITNTLLGFHVFYSWNIWVRTFPSLASVIKIPALFSVKRETFGGNSLTVGISSALNIRSWVVCPNQPLPSGLLLGSALFLGWRFVAISHVWKWKWMAAGWADWLEGIYLLTEPSAVSCRRTLAHWFSSVCERNVQIHSGECVATCNLPQRALAQLALLFRHVV